MARNLNIRSTIKLNSGYGIPRLGFGVYQIPKDQTVAAVKQAFQQGYRHIDCAAGYHNEAEVAAAMKESGIPRSDIFFTTKVFTRQKPLGYHNTLAAIQDALEKTKLDYIDLVLIHAPYGGSEARKGSWRALVEFVDAGKIRSIGVSNFGIHHLEELEAYIKELEAQRGGKGRGGVISVGQWEVHPWLTRPDVVSWCQERGIAVEAFCPIVRGQKFEDAQVKELAERHGKTPAQVLLRWSLQRGLVPLVKSATPERIAENAGIFDWDLSQQEVDDLTTNEYSPCAWDPSQEPL